MRAFALQGPKFHRVLTASLVAATAFALAPVHQASAASTFKTLHSFCSWASCNDGTEPLGGVLVKQSNELYGTTYLGGKNWSGTEGGVVFKLAYDAGTGKWKETVIHNFPNYKIDGEDPLGELIADVDGNLYGTTQFSANESTRAGTVYKLTHGGNGWTSKVVYGFCSVFGQYCEDGLFPQTGLTYAGQASGAAWDKTSPLFGTTWAGGAHDNGTVFKLVYNGSSWQETVIRDFSTAGPSSGLLMDEAGNLFGTKQTGGKYGDGFIFKLAHDTWTETVLHNFCNGCSTGGAPFGGLIMDASGNLFGTAEDGGQHEHGVVFERAANGTYSVLYNFCSVAVGADCTDGSKPEAGVIRDRLGNLFGTTAEGGTGHDANGNTAGTVFKLAPNGDGTWSESVLHSFCSNNSCPDGANPQLAHLALDSAGNLFGTTPNGGPNDVGTVFRIQP